LVETTLTNIDGCLNTEERYINYEKAKDFFNNSLINIICNKKINKKDISSIKKNYDIVIDSTNNTLNINRDKDYFFELALTLLYKKVKATEFDALTMVDGDLFSIFPYSGDVYTLTDVENTPLKKFKSHSKLLNFQKNISKDLIVEKRRIWKTR
jgi:hypothetical protein